MRYAVIADVHSNLEAFTAVMADASTQSVDAYLFCGDAVGYGADPGECIAIMKKTDFRALVLGNHEAGVLEYLGLGYFNEYAKEAVLWTRQALGKEELSFLETFRLQAPEDDCEIVHGSLDKPGKFNYIFEVSDARPAFKLMEKNVCFVGHTHVACAFTLNSDGSVEYSRQHHLDIKTGKKYIVNTGSVGQPRDGDPRASYAVYDNEKKSVEIRRVEYDIKKAQEKIKKNGLPDFLADRLAKGV